MKTFVYIDGFNFYYRKLKGNPQYKWINPKALVSSILKPPYTVEHVRYYTARVSARIDPDAPARQATYLKALSSVPGLTVHEGNFLFSEIWAAPVAPPLGKPDAYCWTLPGPELVRVHKAEEKGSDVNLASHLIRDAFTGAFDAAVVVSSDTDLVEPIRIVVEEVGKPVGLIMPSSRPSQHLMNVASFHRHIRSKHLKAAQFPDDIYLADGAVLTRPGKWTGQSPEE